MLRSGVLAPAGTSICAVVSKLQSSLPAGYLRQQRGKTGQRCYSDLTEDLTEEQSEAALYTEPDGQSVTPEQLFSAEPRYGLVERYFSEDHFSAKQAWKRKKAQIVSEMQAFEHDTGSFPVQIGLLSERIAYLTQHCTTHRKDHHSRRGLLVLLSRRRKFLKYLRRQNFQQYVQVLSKYKLKDNYYESGWGEVHRVGTNLKWTPTEDDPDGKVAGLENMREAARTQRAAAKERAAQRQETQDKVRKEILENRRKRCAWTWERRMRSNHKFMPSFINLTEPPTAVNKAPKT